MEKLGKDFEKAVYAFVKALDPLAEVLFDHKVPDRDSGSLRQCDVWINASFGGHWPLSILVSCKDHTRRLDIGNIGTFCDEVRSTRANFGVVYSSSGFTRPALDKAKANGIACCRLYRNEPANIPDSFMFEHFACTPQIQLSLQRADDAPKLKIWNELFDLAVDDRTVLDVVVSKYMESENRSMENGMKLKSFPPDWQETLGFTSNGDAQRLTVGVIGSWKRYRARVDATLVAGSYCLSNESFQGNIIGPAIALQGKNIGDAWTEVDNDDFALPEKHVLAILQADVRTILRKEIGPRVLASGTQPAAFGTTSD